MRYKRMYIESERDNTSEIKNFCNYITKMHEWFNPTGIFISWEDFFWPISNYLYSEPGSQERLNNQNHKLYNIEVTKDSIDFPIYLDEPCEIYIRRFIERIIIQVPKEVPLLIEQRTNGVFNRIKNNNNLELGYYNPYILRPQWYENINNNFKEIQENLVVEKNYLEWYSRVSQILRLNKNKNLFLNQFNIMDNTYDDDDHHNLNPGYRIFKQKNIMGSFDSPSPGILDNSNLMRNILNSTLSGIGVWALWSTYNGNVYNGGFKYGMENWSTNGKYNNKCITLNKTQSLEKDLTYCSADNKVNAMLILECETDTTVTLEIGEKVETITCNPGRTRHIIHMERFTGNKKLKIVCDSGCMKLHRLEVYNMPLKLYLFDEDKKTTNWYEYFNEITQDFNNS